MMTSMTSQLEGCHIWEEVLHVSYDVRLKISRLNPLQKHEDVIRPANAVTSEFEIKI